MKIEEIEIIKMVFQSYLDIVKMFKKPNYIIEGVITDVRDKLIQALEQQNFEGKTNGDVIKAILNPYRICEYEYSVHVYLTEKDFWQSEYQMNCSTSWWNSPYKEGDTE